MGAGPNFRLNIFCLLLNAFRLYVAYRFNGVFFDREEERRGLPYLYGLSFLLPALAEFVFKSRGGVFVFKSYGDAFIFKSYEGAFIFKSCGGVFMLDRAGLFFTVAAGYRGGIPKKLLAVVLNIGVEAVAGNLAKTIFLRGNVVQAGGFSISFSIFTYFVFEILIERVVVKKGIEISACKNLFLIFLSMGSTFIARALTWRLNEKAVLPALSLSFLLAINVSIFYLYEMLLAHREDVKEKEMYELQMRMYRRQLSLMQNTNDSYRTLRHDMKHHTNMVSEYLDHGEYEKAAEYLRKMNNYVGAKRRYIETGNECIDSILNYTVDEVGKIDGSVRLDIRAVRGIAVDDFDINMILGNLLGNAYEAMKKSPEKELAVFMQYDRGLVRISVKNTYDGNLKERAGKIVTTKEDAANHGIGLTSVKKAVKKYNGDMRIQYTSTEFQVSILLYASLEEDEAGGEEFGVHFDSCGQ